MSNDRISLSKGEHSHMRQMNDNLQLEREREKKRRKKNDDPGSWGRNGSVVVEGISELDVRLGCR